MSLSNGPAETSGHSPRTTAGGEPSPYAPKWVRDGRASQRKVVPLHLPAAPQLVPGASPVEAAAAAQAPRIPHPSGPELLAEDAVLKKLLQRHSPDPHPAKVQPVRDPVGLALGMVARLIVAGCAAAAMVMLLLGVIPLPFRLGALMGSDVAPVVTTLPAVAAAVPQPQQVADAGAGAGSAANATSATDAAALPPARVSTVSVRAAQAGGTDPWALDAGEVERLVARGEAYLAQGDIAAARLILGRAAEARDPRAAFALAATYDPTVLKQLHVVGFKPDVAQARAWYEKAAGYGSAEASRRLAALPN
jgi:hypothetical protein